MTQRFICFPAFSMMVMRGASRDTAAHTAAAHVHTAAGLPFSGCFSGRKVWKNLGKWEGLLSIFYVTLQLHKISIIISKE